MTDVKPDPKMEAMQRRAKKLAEAEKKFEPADDDLTFKEPVPTT